MPEMDVEKEIKDLWKVVNALTISLENVIIEFSKRFGIPISEEDQKTADEALQKIKAEFGIH